MKDGLLLLTLIYLGVSQDENSTNLKTQSINRCNFTFASSRQNDTDIQFKYCSYSLCPVDLYFGCLVNYVEVHVDDW